MIEEGLNPGLMNYQPFKYSSSNSCLSASSLVLIALNSSTLRLATLVVSYAGWNTGDTSNSLSIFVMCLLRLLSNPLDQESPPSATVNANDDAVISLTINETAYGTITIDVDGEIQTITASIYNGFGPGKHNVTFKNLSPGMKNVIVSYGGNYDPTKPEISNGTLIKYFAKFVK